MTIADRYFAVAPEQVSAFRAVLIPDNDLLPLDELPNCKNLATLSDGRVLIHVRLGKIQLGDIREITEVEDPLSLEAIEALDLAGSYVGETRENVLVAFPELDGVIEYNDPETGDVYTRPILAYHKWV